MHSDWTDSTKLIIKSSHKIKEKNIVIREKGKLYEVAIGPAVCSYSVNLSTVR